MRFHVRFSLLAVLAGTMIAVPASSAQAEFGVESRGWFAANCKVPTCSRAPKDDEEAAKAKVEGYSQAAGHPNFGITDFKLKRKVIQTAPFEASAPEGNLKTLRVDVAPGVSTNPEVVTKCSVANFTGTELEPAPGVHAFTPPNCPESKIGTNIVEVVLEVAPKVFKNYKLTGTVYNLEQPEGLSSYFGIALSLEPVLGVELFAHTFIQGHVEWASDYHDYFVIENITPGLLESRLEFEGNIGEGEGEFGSGGFITNPTSCTGPGSQTTTEWHGESYEGATAAAKYETPIGTEGCHGEAPFQAVPFAPEFALNTETTQSDAPDGITTSLRLPHDLSESGIDSSQLKTATVTLPEGMTLNESAARSVTEACTPAQARIHSTTPGVACPAGSQLGTVTLQVPGLPPNSLEGNIYLGGPESGPITGPPFIVYLDAESARYGLSVRLKGEVVPNSTTGRLTVTFAENPEQPFSKAILHMNTGPLAPLANPLTCGTATTETLFTPFTGTAGQAPFTSFAVDSNGREGACSSPLPFSLTQSTQNQSPNAGGHTNFTFNLTRPEGNQYISSLKTTLPAGLVGAIPAVTQCPEPQASQGTCTSASEIGRATVEAGAGPAPFVFSGPVYLTGPYHGAPFGMSIAVPAAAGPFNLGTVVTRATINVDPSTARVTVEASLPRLVKGVLVRIRKISVAVNRQGFLFNPTNCGALATESTAKGYVLAAGGATGTQTLPPTPFQVGECGKLPFKPSFKAASSAKTSKANGAAIETTLNMPSGGANAKSVQVTLPKALPSRLTTLQKACLAATFEANPFSCPAGSFVGGVRANTPALPHKMKGPAILVSHANAAFPDLDLVLEGDGVRVILIGNTDIKNGITKTTFASTPDVPVTSATVNLPLGPHSALAANGNLCAHPLFMPTTIVGWNGVTFKQNTRMNVKGCGVRITGAKVIGRTAFLTVQTFAAGRISGGGSSLATTYRRLRGAARAVSLKVHLSRGGSHRHRPFRTRIRVGFVPTKRSVGNSAAFVTLTFR
jgi:hypothetical protein